MAIGAYDFAGRQIKNHRREIRDHTGFRVCTVSDAESLAGWLATNIAQDERRVEHVRVLLLRHCKNERIEPPTPERVVRIVDSGIRQADAMLVATVVARLKPGHVAGIEALLSASIDDDAETAASTTAARGASRSPEDALSAVKASPGNVSLATMIAEMRKLQIVRQVDLPPDVFTGIAANVVTAWRARAAVESPSHLARHDQPVRLVLLAALLHLREREITDTLVELLNQTVHKINARAEKKVTDELVKEFKRVRNKNAMLHRIAEVSLRSPKEQVETVIYPVVGGVDGPDRSRQRVQGALPRLRAGEAQGVPLLLHQPLPHGADQAAAAARVPLQQRRASARARRAEADPALRGLKDRALPAPRYRSCSTAW